MGAAPVKSGTGSSAGNGASTSAGTSASASSGTAGEGGSSASSTSTSQSAAKGGSGGDASAAAAGTSGGGAPMKPKNPNAIPACEGKNNESACDGAKLYFCIDEAPDGQGETCMSAAMCQVGLKTGKCGMCEPSTYHCDKAELQKCDDTGQWVLDKMCDSELLCKESKGVCDDKICSKDEYKCVEDQLKTCNESLTDLMSVMTCPKGLCNEKGMKCNECDPMVPKACSSSSELTMCDADGKKTPMPCPSNKKYCVADKKDCFECLADTDCGMSKNECGTMACRDNKCVEGNPKAPRTPCGAGNLCDYTGTCVACITDEDCKDPQKACLTGVACVNKVPLTAIASLFGGGYLVTVAAGYSATIVGDAVANGSLHDIKGNASADTMATVTSTSGLTSTGCFGSSLAGSSLSLYFGTPAVPATTDQPFPPSCTAPVPVTISAQRL